VTLLGPALLAGLVALGLPIAAHLLGREPPKKIRFAAVRFLSATEPSVTHRRRIQDVPLLLVRLLLLLLCILALARPAGTRAAGVAVVGEPHDAVIVLDTSRSMELVVDGKTLLAHATERALDLIGSLPPGTRLGLVSSDPGVPRIELSADPERVRTAILEHTENGGPRPGAPRPGAWTLADLVPVATELLQDSGERRPRVIYAIGDATVGGLGSLPAAAEGGAVVVPVPAIDPDVPLPEHVGLDAVGWEPAPELDPRAIRIRAVVTRHGPVPAPDEPTTRATEIALRIGDAEVARATVDLPLDDPQSVEFTHTLLEDDTEVAATVELAGVEDDPLPSDDRRHTWLSAEDAMEVVVVNGDPSELRAHDEVFFLATAIAANDAQHRIRTRSLAPDQLAERIRQGGDAAFSDVDVLVLANVRAPAPDIAPAIVEQVKRGMGLFVAVGDRVEADVYNQRLGSVLPLRMREAVQVGTAPGRTEARVEGLAPADLTHPVFRALGGDLGLTGTRARRIMLLDPDPDGAASIALSFTSGAPALLSRTIGEGRSALLTTTIDRDWADLPLRPGFVPMVASLLSYLADSRRGISGTQVEVGGTREIRSDAPVVVTTPTGRKVSIAPDDEGTATFTDTWTPGHYRAGEGEGASPFVVVVDPSESDTQPRELPSIELAGQREVSISVPRWRELVLLALLLLGLEAVLRSRARRR
jgi:hypothetical protein